MSREIKFRAWDSGVMYESGRIPDKNEHYNNDLSVVVSLTGYCYIIENNGDGNDKIVSLSEYAIPMQFTGLKDKNGKDIFEGDILRLYDRSDWGDPDKVKNYEVVWGEDYPAFTLKGYEDLEYNSLQHATILEACEIIGNIYENPELLSTPEPGKQ